MVWSGCEAPSRDRDDLGDRVAALTGVLASRYVIERELGRGGMATVYLAQDLQVGSLVAVKVLHPDLASMLGADRFAREIGITARLQHPNILPVLDSGVAEGHSFYVMPYVKGESLAQLLEREGQLSIDAALELTGEVADALAHAHALGFMHRDIKPSNILLSHGHAVLADFGIARAVDAAGSEKLTETGLAIGTAAYMSPEQAACGRIDARTDIYSLGCVLYEMLAGQPPFTGASAQAVLARHSVEPVPSLRIVRGTVSTSLEHAIVKAMAKVPADRYSSASQFKEALHRIDTAGHASPDTSRRGRFVAAWILGGFAVAAIAWALIPQAESVSPTPGAVAATLDPGMVVIPGGEYIIGSDQGPISSGPAHRVTLAPFGIDVREVTVGDYAAFIAAGRADSPWSARPDTLLPVTAVRYAEAFNYCAWRHPPDGRLPREEEWEAAARGLTGRSFPWGESWDPAAANTASLRRTGAAPVGSYPRGATPEGVLDLLGNVWEWTMSPMTAYPGGRTTPGRAQNYVIRGGAFDSPDSIVSATYRGYLPPVAERAHLDKTGFRCVMPLRPVPG